MDIGTGELLVIAVLVLIVLVPTKVPALARSLGEAMHELRCARSGDTTEAPASDMSSTGTSSITPPNAGPALVESSVVDVPPVVDEPV